MTTTVMADRVFRDRAEAGDLLGRTLRERWPELDGGRPVVLGLPRGGVPVAAAVARALGAPFDIIVVRKFGVPNQRELAMGAIGEGSALIVNEDIVRLAGVSAEEFARVEAHERLELDRRMERWRRIREREPFDGRTAVIVDDGIATGATMRAAVRVARLHGARRVVVAAPVAPADVVHTMRKEADAVVTLETPLDFRAVGDWYHDFSEVTDEDVERLLRGAAACGRSMIGTWEVAVPANTVRLAGTLSVPSRPVGVVVFAHGSGSSRLSPRNRRVAERLQRSGLATLLLDLLTEDEAADRDNVFDIELLAERVVAATAFVARHPSTMGLPIGLFGASTGAAAALCAAVRAGGRISAVVSRGGRPDLAGADLASVGAPTLLIVGADDTEVVRLNRHAADAMRCSHDLRLVPGATHLFEEPGTLEIAAAAAEEWFLRYLASDQPEQRD